MKHTTATGQLSSALKTTPIRGYMQFEIRARDISISQALRNHIERRLRFALDRFARRIRQVRVTLGDPNGPRGGIDKCCKLAISLDHSSTIVVESHASTSTRQLTALPTRRRPISAAGSNVPNVVIR